MNANTKRLYFLGLLRQVETQMEKDIEFNKVLGERQKELADKMN